MNISFAKIIYVNNTLNNLAPSIPKFKLVIYTDIHMNKLIVMMYTQNNKYVSELPIKSFDDILQNVSKVFDLPTNSTNDLYYGDELYVEIINLNGVKQSWSNIKQNNINNMNCYNTFSGKGFINRCSYCQTMLYGTPNMCSSHDSNRCVKPNPYGSLTLANQRAYENVTQYLYTLMLDMFRNKLPETFYKKF